MAQCVVALGNVQVRHGAATVLDVPSFDVFDSEIVAIIGANGAGKSTLLRVLGLLQEPTCGNVYFRSQIATRANSFALRRRTASVLQTALLLDCTVYANAALGLKLRGVSRAQIEQRLQPWLVRLGIAHLAARPARTLSGGEARRTCLARALVLEPELLLLDEPFSALDAPSREALLLDLQQVLPQSDAGVVIVTHDLYEAAALADRIGVLSQGKLLQIGPIEELLTSPASEQVAAFVAVQHRIWAEPGSPRSRHRR